MKINRLLTLTVLSFLGTACTQEFAEPEGSLDVREVEIGVSLPDASVRTVLGPKGENSYQTLWVEGDRLSLNGLESLPLTADAAGGNVARFKFKGNLTYPYNLLYPATEESAIVTFPAVQEYHEDSFDPRATPMYSAAKTFENATLSHLSSLLKFTLTSQETVTLSQILVTAMGGEHLSGAFEMETDADGLFTGAIRASEGSVAASLSFGESGCTLSSQPKSFFMSIPHGVYTKGFTALIITNDNKVMALKFYTQNGEQTILPSRVIEFETVAFEGDASVLLVRNEADLLALEASQADYSEAVLIDDLDFTDKDWTPVTDLSITLNGAGHVIKGLPAPLCKTLTGVVKDLTIDAAINLTEGVKAAAFAELASGEGALLENCVSRGSVKISSASASGKACLAGLAVEVLDGAAVRNCTNYADVVAASELKGITALSVGGCVSIFSGNMENVSNYGNVTVEPGSALSSYLLVGGVVAEGAPGTLKNAVNSGNVVVERHSTVDNGNRIGGVIGKSKFTSLDGTMISNTVGSSVSFTVTTGAGRPSVGGLIGMNEVLGATLSSLVNKTSVKIVFPQDRSVQYSMMVGGIIGYLYCAANNQPHTELKCINCTNEADISLQGRLYCNPNTPSKQVPMDNGVQIGGIVGRTQISQGETTNKLMISGCKNHGCITIDESEGNEYAYAGGIIGVHSVANTEILDCINEGDVILNGSVAGSVFLGGVTGNIHRGAGSKSQYSACINRGKIALYDKTSSNEVAAGGIIGNASGSKNDRVMTLDVTGCRNEGPIDRVTETPAENEVNTSYAGGIIGVIGRRHKTSIEGYVDVRISDCSNTAPIIFNQFTGYESMLEKYAFDSFTGGIAGCSVANNGSVEIVGCTNSGDLMSTSGVHGGILGFAFAGTSVTGQVNADGTRKYTVNTGDICNMEDLSPSGSSNCIAGGIVGYLKVQETKKSRIEYAWNSADVYASIDYNKGYSAGGIVGRNQEPSAVRYCKNSGKVRNYYKNGKCGSISGTNHEVPVEYCGAGGQVYGPAGWVLLDSGSSYPFSNYIYTGSENIPESSYKGCCWWDGTSVLPWEESDWGEPEE